LTAKENTPSPKKLMELYGTTEVGGGSVEGALQEQLAYTEPSKDIKNYSKSAQISRMITGREYGGLAQATKMLVDEADTRRRYDTKKYGKPKMSNRGYVKDTFNQLVEIKSPLDKMRVRNFVLGVYDAMEGAVKQDKEARRVSEKPEDYLPMLVFEPEKITVQEK
jgi:hypothetical protein